MTGRQQNSLALILFSPRKPRFRRRCAPLKVSLWRRMSADATGSLIWTKRQHPHGAYACEAYMEGIHVGFDRRICTDASSKPLPIADVLSADFSSPWHKSDGQNCVAPAMERFSSGFWCGGRRNTRVFQGRQAGNHRKSPMSGGTDPFHVCPCFLPR